GPDEYIHLSCQKCGKRLRVKKDLAGGRVRCPNKSCTASLEVPATVPPDREETEGEKKRRQFWKWFKSSERDSGIRFTCPHCRRHLRVSSKYAGRNVRCPNGDCRQSVIIPLPTTNSHNMLEAKGSYMLLAWLTGGA